MQLTQLSSPRPGTLDGAAEFLGLAQGAAANVLNAPLTDPGTNLADGVKYAKLAAAELFMAQPRSDFQDLVAARRQVLEGASFLTQATAAYKSDATSSANPEVLRLTRDAFNSFENAFEIIYND